MKSLSKKQYEFIIKAQQDLIEKSFSLNEWSLEANKKVMSTETQNHYLQWKVDYLEKKIRDHLPEVALYDKDDEEFNRIKKDYYKKNPEMIPLSQQEDRPREQDDKN